ncbi:hypothetical protein GGI04_001713 [Coemansia thaxteri]|uniref:Uncharacterized protein n=1 Tax=Coemansia thaxteri TaxID=2663907 RepID=A0A9W8EHH7_9FUNG|nr:hypothetical protein GGI04_001713 [Coemansia thaxteri]KAJ2008017.1 hypothetical protein H4R26_000453 [Coemansia thaxteri]
MSVIAKDRTTMRTVGEKRRQVFKHALGKPQTMPWPAVDQETHAIIVDMICAALQPVGVYFSESRRASKRLAHRKRRAVRTTRAKNSRNVVSPTTSCRSLTDNFSYSDAALSGKNLLSHIVLGINGTTRMLEKQARSGLQLPETDRLALVVVCKGDVDPQMVAHFPGLAHTAYSACRAGNAKHLDNAGLRLFGASKGAEQRLANSACQQRVSVIGIKAGTPLLDEIIQKARAAVAPPVVPWIGEAPSRHNHCPLSAIFYPMQVHELHTTAPAARKTQPGTAAKQKADCPSSTPADLTESSGTISKKRQLDAEKAAGGGNDKSKERAPKHKKIDKFSKQPKS